MNDSPFPRILLVDDEPGDIVLLRAMLNQAFGRTLEVDSAPSLQLTLTALRAQPAPVILLDLGLIDSWGAQTYRSVRQMAPDAVIVVLSGSTDDNLAVQLVREGAQDYLVKGRIESDTLRRVLQYAWERHLIERELVGRRAQWEALVQGIPDAVIISDEHDRIQFANPATERLWGGSPQDLQGRSVTDLHPPESAPAVLDDLSHLRLPNATVASRQLPLMTIDQRVVPTEVVRSSFLSPSGPRVVTVIRDISERKRLEEQLIQTQKMEALGQITAGIAHDFNNLLAVMMGNLELLALKSTDPDTVRRVSVALSSAQRGADLTRRLLAFARVQDLAPRSVSLPHEMAGFLEMIRPTLGPEIVIVNAIPPDLPDLHLDRAALETVLLNLAVNGRDAMPRGGRLVFSARALAMAETESHPPFGDLPAGPYVELSVSDSGVGIPPDILDRVFEPFFTTKGVGRGTGLGLSIVYGFARQSGGSCHILSEPGAGTTVKLLLPVVSQRQEDVRPEVTTHRAGPNASALIVDDEPELLEIARQYLSDLGYLVECARDGSAAEAFWKSGRRFSLLITDILMPGGVDGIQLARTAQRYDPGLKVIYTSGFPPQALRERRLEGVLVMKPYLKSDLEQALVKIFQE